MKRLVILGLLLLLLPGAALAMNHNGMKMDDAKGMDMDHSSMGMTGVVMLEDQVVDGVKASAHLMDDPKMGRMLMVMFTDEKSGAMISEGIAAVKVEGPDQMVSDPQKMMLSQGMYGVGVKLDQMGTYKFTVGTKLKDGQKRTFHFTASK